MTDNKQTNRNRATMAPGGCECSKCGCVFIGGETHTECSICAKEPKQAPAVEAGARDERATLDEGQVIAAIQKACGEYRHGCSYSFEDVWNCIEAVLLARASDAAPDEDYWRDQAWRIFGYKMLCENNHKAIAEHLQAIDAALPGDGDFVFSITCASEAAAGEPIDYDRIVQICEAHGICLPVDCVEMVVEIIRLAAPQLTQAAGEPVVCTTCNGNGMIGGPSYYAPDEGGEPCPVCAAPQPASEPIEDGCTPTDAKMLRANHSLADENAMLRCRLRPFAVLATPRLSWAMVEYCIDGDPEKQTLQAPQMQRAFNRAANALRDEFPSHEPADCDSLDLPDWVKNAKPPAPDQPASEQQHTTCACGYDMETACNTLDPQCKHHPASEQRESAIDLAAALEQQRALAIVAAVRAQGFAKSNSDLPTQAESVFDLACEEIEHRLRTEVWTLNGTATPLPGEQQAARWKEPK